MSHLVRGRLPYKQFKVGSIPTPSTMTFREDLHCGRHSGIRLCCILWYSIICQHVLYGRWWTYRPYWKAIDLAGRLHGKAFDHIPCPGCLLLGQVVEVLECDCMKPLGEMADAAGLNPATPCGCSGSTPEGATKRL